MAGGMDRGRRHDVSAGPAYIELRCREALSVEDLDAGRRTKDHVPASSRQREWMFRPGFWILVEQPPQPVAALLAVDVEHDEARGATGNPDVRQRLAGPPVGDDRRVSGRVVAAAAALVLRDQRVLAPRLKREDVPANGGVAKGFFG